MLRVVDRFFGGVAWIEQWVHKHFAATVVVAVVLVALNELSLFGSDLSRWDWLFVSGWLTFVVSWRMALGLPRHADNTIERLSRRQVLKGAGTTLRDGLAASAETWSRVFALVTAVVVFVGFAVAFRASALTSHALFTVLASVAGFFVGRVFGRGIAIGLLGRKIERGDWTLRMQPGHIDGAAGLKPVGELYFRQAMVLAIPALFLATWWVLMPVVGKYEHWRDAYLGQLVFAVVIEIGVFVVPMVSFHRSMSREKRKLLEEVDEHSEKLKRLEHELPDITDDARRQSVAEQVALLRERYLRLEQMPTWPVDASIRRRFEVNNAVLLLPVVVKTLGMTLPGGELLTKLGEIFGAK